MQVKKVIHSLVLGGKSPSGVNGQGVNGTGGYLS